MYASKKSAVRAARKQGHDVFDIVEDNGMFAFVVPAAQNENEIVETVEIDNEGDSEGTPSVVEYTLPNDEKPVAFVWAFLALNRDVAERKVLIRAMIDMGYNGNMVKTQTSRFYSVDGDKDAYLAMEKSKRDAEKARIDELAAQIKAERELAEIAEGVSEADEHAAEQLEGNAE